MKYGSQWVSITDELVKVILANEEKITSVFSYTNCADELFIQEEVYSSKNVYLSGWTLKDVNPLGLFESEIFFNKNLEKMSYELLNKNLYFSDEVLTLVEKEAKALDIDNCIGVYVRGTDYVKLRPSGEYVQPNVKQAESFIYINDALYDYRIGSGMTRRFDKNYYIGFKTVLEQIRNQKNSWKICDFERLFAVKVMQTVGRAITQSRYGFWKSYPQQKEYFTNIRNDELVDDALSYLKSIKGYLQTNHYYLLTLLKFRLYFPICMLLYIKNTLCQIGRGKGK